MTAQTIQAFDGRRPVIVNPIEIQVDDWMRDQGRLRQVESIADADSRLASGVLVRFSDSDNGPYATLSVPNGVTVTVWRKIAGTGAPSRAAA